MPTTILITGANRGLGRAAAEHYLARPDTTVVATVRDPSHATSQSLAAIAPGPGSALVILQLNSATFDPQDLSARLATHGVHTIDIVLASAAISQVAVPIAQIQLPDLEAHMAINAYGILALFQGTLSLLEKSPDAKFVVFGSPLGSIGGMERRAAYPTSIYGASKAVAHYFVRRMHFEHPGVTAFVVDPGFVQTDMWVFLSLHPPFRGDCVL